MKRITEQGSLPNDTPWYDPIHPFRLSGDTDEEEDNDSAPRSSSSDPDNTEDYMCPEEDARRQHHACAVKALEYYNKKNGTNYELVDALNSNGFLDNEIWIHCNFTAKQKMVDMDGECSPKLFFAELHGGNPFHSVVTACRILKGKTTVGCMSCEYIKHPTHGFRCGHFCYQPHNLRSRSPDY